MAFGNKQIGKPLKWYHRLMTALGAILLTLAFFLVLPIMQTISQPPASDLELTSVSSMEPPPPPPMEEEPEEPEPEEEPPPPEIADTPPMDLSQLELALNPGGLGGGVGGDFVVNLMNTAVKQSADVDAIFSMADLDQKPRPVYQPAPVFNSSLRAKAPATVYIIFVVSQKGKVEMPKVQKSTDPAFNSAAMAAIKQWRFEPGKRGGKPVRFRMRVPITFPKG